MSNETDAAMAVLVKQVAAVTDDASHKVAALLNGLPSVLAAQGASLVDVATFTATLNAGAPALMDAVAVSGPHGAAVGPVVTDISVPAQVITPLPPDLLPPLVPPLVKPAPPPTPVVQAAGAPDHEHRHGGHILLDIGTANAVVVAPEAVVAHRPPKAKDAFRVKITVTNTGPVTFDPGTGALPVGKVGPTGTMPLAPGDLAINDVVDFQLDEGGTFYKYTMQPLSVVKAPIVVPQGVVPPPGVVLSPTPVAPGAPGAPGAPVPVGLGATQGINPPGSPGAPLAGDPNVNDPSGMAQPPHVVTPGNPASANPVPVPSQQQADATRNPNPGPTVVTSPPTPPPMPGSGSFGGIAGSSPPVRPTP